MADVFSTSRALIIAGVAITGRTRQQVKNTGQLMGDLPELSGINWQEYAALLHLADETIAGVTVSQLSTFLLVSGNTAKSILNKFLIEEWVTREQLPPEKKSGPRPYRLTELGMSQFEDYQLHTTEAMYQHTEDELAAIKEAAELLTTITH